MTKPRQQLSLIEANGYQPTPENVRALTDEIWRLQEQVARVRNKAASDMRELAVAKYKEFCKNDCFTDDDVIRALQTLPLPTD